MKYLLLIYNNREASDAWLALPPAEQQASMDLYWALDSSLKESGEFLGSEPLQGAETATLVQVRDGKRTTTDGPFAETKEVLGGYYLVDCDGLDRALEIAAQVPDAQWGTVEVRPVMDMSAFAPDDATAQAKA
ncbi:MAG: YciI family protein [Candidatus Nanopelagicales bacterium]